MRTQPGRFPDRQTALPTLAAPKPSLHSSTVCKAQSPLKQLHAIKSVPTITPPEQPGLLLMRPEDKQILWATQKTPSYLCPHQSTEESNPRARTMPQKHPGTRQKRQGSKYISRSIKSPWLAWGLRVPHAIQSSGLVGGQHPPPWCSFLNLCAYLPCCCYRLPRKKQGESWTSTAIPKPRRNPESRGRDNV